MRRKEDVSDRLILLEFMDDVVEMMEVGDSNGMICREECVKDGEQTCC